jgi:hypothetical protein
MPEFLEGKDVGLRAVEFAGPRHRRFARRRSRQRFHLIEIPHEFRRTSA